MNKAQASFGPATAIEPGTAKKGTFLGQTKAAWYIYLICGVASIANIFQGFDSGIYSIIISDKRFINYFQISGARSGVVASMGMANVPARERRLTRLQSTWAMCLATCLCRPGLSGILAVNKRLPWAQSFSLWELLSKQALWLLP